MLKELPPTWRLARKIHVTNISLANSITLSILILSVGLTAIFLELFGYSWSQLHLDEYKYQILAVILFIHFVPVSIYSTKRMLSKRFKDFRLVVVDDKNIEEDTY